MSSSSNQTYFELLFRDNLSSPLHQATQKGIGDLKGLENAKKGLGASGEGLTSSLGGVTSSLGAMLGPAALVTAGVGLLGVGLKSVVSTGMDFTKVMSNAKALLNATDKDFKKLNDTVISLGASTSFSSSQVADAVVVAAQAGQGIEDIIKSLPGYLDLAASSGLDLAQSVEIGLSTMQQFGLQSKDVSKIVDELSYTSVKSSTGLNDLAEGLKYIGVSAASFKVPLSETLASLGVLADNGEKGSVGARSLSTALQRLSAPTKAMKDVMSNLNLQFFDAKGQFIGINNTIALLEDRLKGATDEQKANALSLLFGNEAYGEFNILLKSGSKNLKSLTGEIENSNGTAARISKQMLDNLSGDAEQFFGAWESLQLKMFGQGESGFRGLVQIGTSALNTLANAWNELTAPIGEVWSVLGDVYNQFADIFKMFGGENVNLLKLVFHGLAESIKFALTPLKFMLSTIKLIVVNLRNIFAGDFSFKKFFVELGNTVKDVLLPIGDIFKGIFTLDWDILKSGAGKFRENFANFRNDFADRLMVKDSKKETAELTVADSLGLDPKTSLNNLVTGSKGSKTSKINSELTDVSGVGGRGGKSLIVNFTNLIGSMTVNGNSITDLEKKIKDVVSKSLIEAVNDFETSYN